MKRFFLIAAFAGAVLCSCQSEIGNESVPTFSGVFTISIDAVKGADTKALTVSPDGKTLNATWEQGDQVAVCRIDPQNNDLSTVLGVLTPSAYGSASTTLSGTILMEGVSAGDKLYLQYPFKVYESPDGNRWLDSPYRGQDGDLATVGKEFAYASCGVDITSLEGNTISTSKAEFYNRQAIVKFSLLNGGSPLEASKLRIFSPDLSDHLYHDDYYVDRGGLDVISSAPRSEFTVALRNQDTSTPEPYTLYAVNSNGVYTATTAPKLFTDGTYNRGSGNLTPVSYEGFNDSSTWTVIGSMSEYGVLWNNDLNMWTDGKGRHVAASVTLKAGDEIKFRRDQDWSNNLGGSFKGATSTDNNSATVSAITVPDAFGLDNDGYNIYIPADGTYDIYLDEYTYTAIIVPASGAGKVSTLVSEPQQPSDTSVWTIIGVNGDWEYDILADESPEGVWTAIIDVPAATSFKWRMDRAWDYDYGGTLVSYDTPFEAVSGGPNVEIGAGWYKIVLDLTDSSAPTITVYDLGEVWSLIGSFSNWSQDLDMTQDASGRWVSPEALLSGDFKLRRNHGWEVNLGADAPASYPVTPGEAFPAVYGGQNLVLPEEANYVVTYDPSAGTILVEKAGALNPYSSYVVVGESYLDVTGNDVVFTSQWNLSEAANNMIDNDGSGIFVWTKYIGEFSQAIPIKFKVVKDFDYANGSWPADNFEFTILGKGTLIITFNTITREVKAEMEYDNHYTVVGTDNMFGAGWDPADPANDMVWDSGLWTLTKEVTGPCDVEFKVVYDHSYAKSWPVENYQYHVKGTGKVYVTISFNATTSEITVSEAEQSPIVIDGSFDDWAELGNKAVVARNNPNSPFSGVDEIRVYANSRYVFYYIEYDATQIASLLEITKNDPDHNELPIRLHINTDGEFTSGYTMYALDAYDFIIEGSLAKTGLWSDFSGNLYQRINNKWSDPLAGFSGLCSGAGKDNKYEIRIDRDVFNTAALSTSIPKPMGDVFQTGIRFYTPLWLELSNLPNDAVSGENPNGWGHLLEVTVDK